MQSVREASWHVMQRRHRYEKDHLPGKIFPSLDSKVSFACIQSQHTFLPHLQAQTLEDLQSFNLEGYRFSASQSGKDRLVFLRSKGSRPSENEAKDAVASSAKDEPLKTTKRGGAKGGKDKKTIVGKGPVTTTSAGKRQPTPASEHQPTRKAAKAKVNNASPALRRSARHE